MYEAINRKEQLKKCKRVWKLKLIESNNPGWKDLFDAMIQQFRLKMGPHVKPEDDDVIQ